MARDEVDQFRDQVKALTQRLRREQPTLDGVSSTELRLLTLADLAPTPLRPGMFAVQMRMTTPNVAAALRSLEKRGMIGRRQDPGDRRQRYIDVTDAGRDLVERARRIRYAWLHEAIASIFTDDERQDLFRAGSLIQRLADAGPLRR